MKNKIISKMKINKQNNIGNNRNSSITGKLDKILKALEETETLLSFDAACKYLCVSSSTLYKLTANGIISHFKPNGKLIYFSKAQLNDWIKSRKVLKKSLVNSNKKSFNKPCGKNTSE
jgi:excisionase family DNA binding protein